MEFGYWFYASKSKNAPGGNRLDIILRETSTEQFFTPQRIRLCVETEENMIEMIHIHHPWLFEKTYQVLPGFIGMYNEKDEEVCAYTLGGTLKVEQHVKSTLCILESPAPIMKYNDGNPVLELFIDEIEILLAEQKAEMSKKSINYEERFLLTDPMELYLSILNALIDNFDHSHHKENSQIIQFTLFLHAERRRLKNEGLFPLFIPSLDNLLHRMPNSLQE
jgi:hypothetical protein